MYVNNNGNVTFDEPLATYTPFDLRSTSRKIVAPFFADVDTRADGTEPVVYGYGTAVVDGHRAFGVNWKNVGYYSNRADKTNTFQLVLIDRSDVAPGDFDIEFNYDRVLWEAGTASGGVDGLGGNSARAGWSNGSTMTYELPGSAVNGALLDSSPTGLVHHSLNSEQRARYVFAVRGGVVQEPQTPLTVDAGADVTAAEGSSARLVGATPSDSSATTRWSVPAGTPCSIGDPVALQTTITCTDNGVFEATLTATAGERSASDTVLVTVSNAVPVVRITAPADMESGTVLPTGQPLTLTAPISDPGSRDTHTCSIEWGDGSPRQTGTVTAGTCSAPHVYASDGVFSVRVEVLDDDGGSGTAAVDVVVAKSAKVTGGGWVVTEGRYSFGFVVKSRAPGFYSGQIQLRTPGGHRFHGNTVTALTSTAGSATWSGNGRYQGVDGHRFEVRVVDGGTNRKGSPDTVSLSVWAPDGKLVMSTGTQALKGGNLTVHK